MRRVVRAGPERVCYFYFLWRDHNSAAATLLYAIRPFEEKSQFPRLVKSDN